MSSDRVNRRQLLQWGGALAAVANASSELKAGASGSRNSAPVVPGETHLPKLAMLTKYFPQRLAFAAKAGYEAVEISRTESFTLEKLTDTDIDRVKATAKEAGIAILSLSCPGMNHIDKDPNNRRNENAVFLRCLELGHRLGCSFISTLSGGIPGAKVEDQVKAFSDVVNQRYLPVCEKLNLRMGWENYPDPENFATVPGIWEEVLERIPNRRVGLEFDPSHLVRQFIDPVRAAWDFRDRILGFHAKDTEIVQPVLQKVGIHGEGWWRYRIPGQGLVDWPKLINVLLGAKYEGGVAVEHEDDFFDEPNGDEGPEMAASRRRGFVLAKNFLSQYLPGATL